MGRRRTAGAGQADGLREALLAEHRRLTGPGGRWHIANPEYVDPDGEYWTAMAAGEPVGVSSSQILCALIDAGEDAREYGYVGRFYEKDFILGEGGGLTIVPYPEPDRDAPHCG